MVVEVSAICTMLVVPMSNDDVPKPPPVQLPYDMSQPPVQSGPTDQAPAPPSVIDTLIPSKNGHALLSYYLGLFSIFPLFGLVMGAIAVRSGRIALKAVKENPGLAGSTHAKVGIGCGAIGFLFNLSIVLLILGILLFGQNKT